MKRVDVGGLSSGHYADRFGLPSKNKTLPKSDLFMSSCAHHAGVDSKATKAFRNSENAITLAGGGTGSGIDRG